MNLGFRLSGSGIADKTSKPHRGSSISLQAWPLSFWGFRAPEFGFGIECLQGLGFRVWGNSDLEFRVSFWGLGWFVLPEAGYRE